MLHPKTDTLCFFASFVEEYTLFAREIQCLLIAIFLAAVIRRLKRVYNFNHLLLSPLVSEAKKRTRERKKKKKPRRTRRASKVDPSIHQVTVSVLYVITRRRLLLRRHRRRQGRITRKESSNGERDREKCKSNEIFRSRGGWKGQREKAPL